MDLDIHGRASPRSSGQAVVPRRRLFKAEAADGNLFVAGAGNEQEVPRDNLVLGCSGTLPCPRPCPSGAGGRQLCRQLGGRRRRWGHSGHSGHSGRAAAARDRGRGCGDTTPTTLTPTAQGQLCQAHLPTAAICSPTASWELPEYTDLKIT